MEEKLVVLGQLKRSNFYKAGIWNRPRSLVSKICLWIWGCLSRKLLTILWNWKNLLSITFWSGGFKTCQTTKGLIEIILDKNIAQKLRAIFKFLVLPKLISQQGSLNLSLFKYILFSVFKTLFLWSIVFNNRKIIQVEFFSKWEKRILRIKTEQINELF